MSFRKSLKVRRYTTGIGHYEEGIWVEAPYEEMTIKASVQPETSGLRYGRGLDNAQGGRSEGMVYRLYTDTKLESVDSDNPDVVIINNDEYEIATVEAWQNGVLSHYKCIAVRKNA